VAPTLPQDHLIVINLSGRGDKDMSTVLAAMDASAENADKDVKREA